MLGIKRSLIGILVAGNEAAANRKPVEWATQRRSVPAFEESLRKLEDVVSQLEKGDLSLEASMAMFEQTIALSGQCKRELDQAEERVEAVIKEREESHNISEPPAIKKPGKRA
jgi:exodeoxyribonuclease VII small subunit